MDSLSMHTASGGAGPLVEGDAREDRARMRARELDTGAEPMVLREVEEREVPLRGPDLEEADGVIVMLPATFSLCYTARGELAASHRHAVDEEDIAAARAHLAHLVREGKVHFVRKGEAISPATLAAAGKPFYIEVDDAGRKRLRRTYVA
jgi:hypothetical protein